MTDHVVREKLEQAISLLDRQGIDLWLTFVRETSLTKDPSLDMVAGVDMTWHSAFIVCRSGDRLAIVGRFDVENIKSLEAYSEVIGYDQGIRRDLFEVVTRLDPQTIAVNFSENDPAADGLTYGMFLDLMHTFKGTPYADRFISAEGLIASLRGQKSPSELQLIKEAVLTTEQLYSDVGKTLQTGQTEIEIAGRLTSARKALGLGTAWGEPYCPIVNAGPDSPVGHAAPGNFVTQRGQLLHMDFGVKQNGFCSDLQRMWYFLDDGETAPPEDVQKAWEACWGAIDAGYVLLKPGVEGWQVDAAARAYLVAAGYPEYQHALGHHLGRVAHDGSTLLGPRWDRYGRTPYGVVEPGNVFTLELGTYVPGRGYIGLEEDVLVTDQGVEWLSTP
ncbi:MAG: Xaa-Pro peptidase family protein, partial [Chloroflexota bacterium]|nr:Xaa-Pro peptidase family protein [Chloroflexota bacterium]